MTVRRRIHSTTAALCTVVLGLVACSSNDTPPATNPPATSAPSTPASTTPTTSSSPSSASSSAGATAAALDAATITWFKSFCTEFAALANIGKNQSPTPGASSDTPQQKQAKLAGEMEAAAAAFDNAATKLSSAPAPGISGGQAAATGVITGLKDIATFIRDAASDFEAASVTDEASLAAAQKATEEKMSGITQVIQQKILVPLTPALSQLQGNEDKFPECAALSS